MLPNFLRRLLPAPLIRSIRNWVLSTRVVAELYMRVNPRLRSQRVTPETVLVIDGFPRSANSFVAYAFRMLLGEDARISSNTHSPQVVHRAVSLGRPCVLLIREPDAVVSSLLTFDPTHSEVTAFRDYARYYEDVGAALGQVVVADFQTATNKFAEVVRRVNSVYGPTVSQEDADALTPEAVLARIDARAQELLVAGAIAPDDLNRRISRPVEGRERHDLAGDDQPWAEHRKRAWQIYEQIVG